ncbi:MAG: class I SAM-dependent methyltransferase [Acidobacteriota bacterium]
MSVSIDDRLRETACAFDSVAPFYDGPFGNGAAIQHMREVLWREVATVTPPPARLLDLGCGTGLDAVHFASVGYEVVAIDSSPEMAARARARAAATGWSARITVRELGIHRLDELQDGIFDALYSDLGPLNCLPDLAAAVRHCARLLPPGGRLVASVIGRWCPREIAHYLLRGHPRRALLRLRPGVVPVGLNGHTVSTRYWTPRGFAAVFAPCFSVRAFHTLALFAPPPYLARRQGADLGSWHRFLAALDDKVGGWPLLRSAGDHFLITLVRRG